MDRQDNASHDTEESMVLEDWEPPRSPVFHLRSPVACEFDAASSEECDQPQLLEIEAFGVEEETQYVSEDEQSEICSTAASINTNSDPPLYDGAPLTLSSSNVLIMQYKMRHKLTDESLDDLLQLLRLHCPTPNHCLPSIYYFKKHFRDLECPMQFHYFCSSCYQEICEPQSSQRCPNHLCCSDLTKPGAKSSFIQIPIQPQLQTLFHR